MRRDAYLRKLASKDNLLDECLVALTDWLYTYASDMCDPQDVEKAYKRIGDGGGTLAYIASLREKVIKNLEDRSL